MTEKEFYNLVSRMRNLQKAADNNPRNQGLRFQANALAKIVDEQIQAFNNTKLF